MTQATDRSAGKGKGMKTRNEKSSLRIGRIAARVLASDSTYTRVWGEFTWAEIKALAASVLTQLPDKVKRKLKGARP